MNNRMFRCRLARIVDGVMQVVVYVGPYESIPHGWSMFVREVVRRNERARHG
ncbi:hypothetical protein FHW69_001635 [Luteibacter sp. Sphag1AF]|nr:hypothetical protein [Luteibacter sp. Sphag1AF]